MLEAKRRQPADILVAHLEALDAELVQHRVHVDRVPEHDEVDDEAERAELIFLTFAVALPQFAALAVEHGPGELMPTLAAVELHQDAMPVCLFVNIGQQVRNKSQLVATKTLGMRAADHFHATPNIIALLRDEDENFKNIPQQRAFVLMDLLEKQNLPRITTLAELSVRTDHATRSFIAELSYWDGMTQAERDYDIIQSLSDCLEVLREGFRFEW